MTIKLSDLEAKRRDAILNAALREFAQKGYQDASTNVIAKEAGISKPLMFHYIGSKQELFLFVYDTFSELLDSEYFRQVDYQERDLFKRLKHSYLLQMELLKKYPWILDFAKLSHNTHSEEINSCLEKRKNEKTQSCCPGLFENIEESLFRPDLDVDQCKQFIYWSNVGFTNQILEKVKSTEYTCLDYGAIVAELDAYFAGLRKIFYR